MRLLHYIEIQNFKRFGDKQRIELDHPAVLIGPNNCGKTTVIQAIALWSQSVKTWYENKGKAPPKKRTSTSLNRLNIVSVPVQRTRYFWHNTAVRKGNKNIPLIVSLGVLHENKVEPVTMRFRNQGDDLVYCTPDEATLARPEVIATAAELSVELLYPMSGLETEEPVLQPGRIDVLLGQGQTAQVLRNLCLLVYRESTEDWDRIAELMKRLFNIQLGKPEETVRGSITLFYRQDDVKELLEVALAGRGFQQMLLIFAYLYSHRHSVLLIDEPDAHLEILRQKQVYANTRTCHYSVSSRARLVKSWIHWFWNAYSPTVSRILRLGRDSTPRRRASCGRREPRESNSATSPRSSSVAWLVSWDTPCCFAKANCIGSWTFRIQQPFRRRFQKNLTCLLNSLTKRTRRTTPEEHRVGNDR